MNGLFEGSQGDKQSPAQPSAPEKVKVPDVTGLTSSEAEQKLTDVGLKVGQVSSIPSDTVAVDRVISSGIEAGTPVDPGTQVNLTISSGPQPSSSASSSSSASASPAATASSSASAQPVQQEDRPAAEKPAAREKAAKVKVQAGPSLRGPNGAEPGEDKGHKRGKD